MHKGNVLSKVYSQGMRGCGYGGGTQTNIYCTVAFTNVSILTCSTRTYKATCTVNSTQNQTPV